MGGWMNHEAEPVSASKVSRVETSCLDLHFAMSKSLVFEIEMDYAFEM